MTLLQPDDNVSSLSKNEKASIIAILSLAGVLTIIDVVEDWIDGAPLSHIIPEVLVIFGVVGIALYIFRGVLHHRKGVIEQAKNEVQSVKKEATQWRAKADSLRSGITDAISNQLIEWGLTPAEQEVSFLLLKGLTIQEISEIRQTSERTIRQQASVIYKKSGLTGRAQLSAFFLEDLFDR